MKRKGLMIMLGLVIILASTTVANATTNRMRVLGNGGLVGIVSDEAIDLELNSAQLSRINDNKLFMDMHLRLEDDENYFFLAPKVAYQLQSNNTLGIYADINSHEDRDDVLSFRIADAIQIDDKLAIGGRVGMVDWKDENEVVLEGGFVYQPSATITIDGSLGINHGFQLYDNIYEDNTNLFLRRTKEINKDESIVALIDLEFYDDESEESQKIAIGKNSRYKDSFLAYGLDFYNQDDYTKIDFNWGAESIITEKVTLRVGSKHRLFAKNNDDEKLSTPRLNHVNVGLTYNYNQQTQIDIAYLPYVQLGDDATTDINISLTKVF
ncbi:hypothetical protein [Halanaerobacter jeridensis]|uniref:Porin n=1 Tax=Halanaerobacter jeridensis TaxID=706427 RepID=A0A938XRT5_9FIRM|nr:hypothetical protein [Halanaerobacter jeridensis]MBM7555634.1 hypothetical protein [Halanaerobacter jeridensis]